MVRFARILLFLWPAAEIVVLIAVADWLGVGPTLLALLGAAIAGIVVIRVLGGASLVELRRALERREPPAGALLRGACVLVAGVLLILPGFIGDVIALLLLIPPLRTVLLGALWRGIPRPGAAPGTAPRTGGRGATTIEGEYHEVPTEQTGPRLDDKTNPGAPPDTRHPDA
jgi:UPF0716 protein FxsA